jgi:protein-S-isoprenylcysteine O-methyltransferase Ste14
MSLFVGKATAWRAVDTDRGSWAALAVLAVVPTVGLLVRIRFEERALLEGLGEQYRRFAAGRRRLFPGVW